MTLKLWGDFFQGKLLSLEKVHKKSGSSATLLLGYLNFDYAGLFQGNSKCEIGGYICLGVSG